MKKTTHSYAVLKVSLPTYLEIKLNLEKAGYTDQFYIDEGCLDPIIDMHGIALMCEKIEF